MVVAINKKSKPEGKLVKFKKNKEVKLKKDGTPKQTVSGSKEGDIHLVEPLRTKEDIALMKKYFESKVTNSTTDVSLKIAHRNLLLFKFGINIGLRMGDILDLTWGKIFYQEGVFADSIRIKEEKTSKFRDFYLNDACKEAIKEYISAINPDIKENKRIFVNQKSGSLDVRTINKIIKTAASECKLNYRCGTHTIRKTWAYHQLISHPNDPLFIAQLMFLLNHSSVSATLHYAGISSDNYRQYYYDVNL